MATKPQNNVGNAWETAMNIVGNIMRFGLYEAPPTITIPYAPEPAPSPTYSDLEYMYKYGT